MAKHKPKYVGHLNEKQAKQKLADELARTGLSRADYYRNVYLTSDHWKALRAVVLEKGYGQCRRCPRTTGLQVHHMHYGNLFDVRPGSLIVLCGICHTNLHFTTGGRVSRKKLKVPSKREL